MKPRENYFLFSDVPLLFKTVCMKNTSHSLVVGDGI